MNEETWCALPFFHLSTDPTGNIRPCCRAEPIATIRTSTFKQAWDGEQVASIRRDFLAGKKSKSCQSCWDYEAKGITSFRQRVAPKISTDFSKKMREHTNATTGKTAAPIKYLELKLTNKCNLICRMCNSENSSRWAQLKRGCSVEPIVSRYFDSPEVQQEIKAIINHPEFETICFVGGEPFIDESHNEYLSLIENKSNIAYLTNTNLTHLVYQGRDVLKSLKDFREVTLIVSIDGDSLRQSYIRVGINIKTFENNLRRIQNECTQKRWTLQSSAVISLLNILHIPELIEYSLQFDLIPVPFTILEHPFHLKLNLLPLRERVKIKEKILEWYEQFNLHQFIDSRNLRRLRAHYSQTKSCLDQSIISLCNALDDIEVNEGQQGVFIKEMMRLDIINRMDGKNIHPILFEIFNKQ